MYQIKIQDNQYYTIILFLLELGHDIFTYELPSSNSF